MKQIIIFLLFGIIPIFVYSQAWLPQTSGTTNTLYSIYFTTNNTGYAVAVGGKIKKTIDGGINWTAISSGLSTDLLDVRFTSIDTGYIVGRAGVIIKTINAGISWSSISPTTSIDFTRIFTIGNDLYVSGYGGTIIKSSNGGTTWTTLNTGTTTYLYGTFFTDLNTGYAVGYPGIILKTINGGISWVPQTSGTSFHLISIIFTDNNNGYIVGGDIITGTHNGIILKTSNGGATWTSQLFPNNFFGNVRFLDSTTGFVAGGDVVANTSTILKTNDAGVTWLVQNSNSSRQFGLCFPDNNVGYSCGLNGTILKWANNIITPDARFTSSAPGCINQQENFYSVMNGATGAVHSWDFGSGATPATSILDNPTGIVYSTSGAKLVTHIVTTSLGSDTITNIITINPSPTASFTSVASACLGTPVDYTNIGSSGNGITYSWDFGTGASPNISTTQNPKGIIYSNSGMKTIISTVTNQFGCVTSSTQTITISNLPIADAGKDTTICANTSVQIGNTPISGNTYSWFPSSTLNISNIANPISTPLAPVTQYIINVVNNLTGCINKDTINVTMLAPLLANAGVDGTICKKDSIQIGTGLIKGQIYAWTPSAGLSSTILPNPVTSPDSTTTYTLVVTGSGCPAVTDEVTITVHPLPLVMAGTDDTITVGSTAQLIATGGLQYSWTPIYNLNNAGIYNPIANPDTTISYIVSATDVYGCINKDTVKIIVIAPSCWLPSAFTPDGNGYNDILYVRGEQIQNFEFGIFNRWGEQIFYTKNINVGWDGKRQASGEELPEGAYAYFVKGTLSNGQSIQAKGLVNLIR